MAVDREARAFMCSACRQCFASRGEVVAHLERECLGVGRLVQLVQGPKR
jgi:hypothetical protein